MQIDIKKIQKLFKAFSSNAEDLFKDKKGVINKVKEGFEKATKNETALGDVWHKLQLLLHLAKDYANGTYTNVDRKTIVVVVGGLLYFISPIDLIPDFLVGIGLIDDVFIIGYVYNKVAKELLKYQEWKNKNKITIHI